MIEPKRGRTLSFNDPINDSRRLKDLLKQALAELEYFKNRYNEFRPLLISEIKKELE